MVLLKSVFGLLVIAYVSLNIIHGSDRTVSQSRSLENRHVRQIVKTIKEKNGDLYDCIDFYEQPAFKHPRLKNHKFYPEMRPNFNFTVMKDVVEVGTSLPYALSNGGCPHGNVPIKRLSKADHARIAMFSKTYAYNSINEQTTPGTHFAIVQTKPSSTLAHYYGVGALLGIWNPQVREHQYSASRITIQNGPDSISAGWMVNPTMYKNNQTHMFIHTIAGESHCYNTYCPGFVLVRSDIPPDFAIGRSTVPGKHVVTMNIFVYRETTFGNWWLLVSKDGLPGVIAIGFWPERIFNNLSKFGNYVSCGGETYSPPNQPGGYPPMGSGKYPAIIPEQDAFAAFFETANEKLQRIDVQDTETFCDTNKYIVRDIGISKEYGHTLFFGGHGG